MEKVNEGSGLVHNFSNQLADAVEFAGKSLVLVNGRQRQPSSGIVYATNMVLTTDHALEREEDLTIQTHDGRTLPATFVGRDPSTDLAVLQVADLALEPATQASDPARVGHLVLAVGRPSEQGAMASIGIVSAVGGPLRYGRSVSLDQYIRTDAIPYPGFSGGPLIDTRGHVIGVITTGLVSGATLAVPASIAWKVAETLGQQGYIKRGYLGISSQPVELPEGQRAGRNQEQGLLVVRVENDSPAQKGGLLLGDILVAVDGQAVSDTDDLQALLTGERVGKQVTIEAIRGNVLQKLPVTVGQRSQGR